MILSDWFVQIPVKFIIYTNLGVQEPRTINSKEPVNLKPCAVFIFHLPLFFNMNIDNVYIINLITQMCLSTLTHSVLFLFLNIIS